MYNENLIGKWVCKKNDEKNYLFCVNIVLCWNNIIMLKLNIQKQFHGETIFKELTKMNKNTKDFEQI